MHTATRTTLFGAAALLGSACSPLAAQSAGQGEALTPACALLSVDEIRELTGRADYPDDTDGDAAGEGLGGGSSCVYGGRVWGSEYPPEVAVVLIPGRGWTERRRGVLLAEGCERDEVSGVGENAFFESCPGSTRVTLYARADAANDLAFGVEILPPATEASLRPIVIAVARAAIAKLR